MALAGAGFGESPRLVNLGGLLQRASIITGFTWLTAVSARALRKHPPPAGPLRQHPEQATRVTRASTHPHARGHGTPRSSTARAARVGGRVSGSGKLTLARELAARLGAPYAELDAISHQPRGYPCRRSSSAAR